ncbi:MAG: PHP domain-containing protein [Oscillospiraceae bacterium]
MYKADLHIHSTVSDGSDSIAAIISAAKAKHLDAIAITDHDTLAHLGYFPDDPGIRLIGGIEISAVDKRSNMRTHILGYNIKNPHILPAFTQPVLEARNRNSERQAEILIEHGFALDIDKLERADGKYLYKQHIMAQLVKSGQAAELFGSFYYKTFKNGGICAFDIDYPDAFEAVRLIKESGGKAVLAHAGQQENFYLIPELVKAGLDGLELNHHANNERAKKIITAYAQEYGLFLTGGSDYHGAYEPQPFGIGDFIAEESGVKTLCLS